MCGQPRAPTEVLDADVASVSGAADKVLRVRGSPDYLIHLEFVSGHDAANLPEMVHLRSTLLANRHQLLCRSLVVLLRPGADSPELNGDWTVAFDGEEPHLRFRYRVLRVWQIPPRSLLAGGLGLLPLAPISAVTAEELPGIMEEVRRRLGRWANKRRAAELWSATGILLVCATRMMSWKVSFAE